MPVVQDKSRLSKLGIKVYKNIIIKFAMIKSELIISATAMLNIPD